MHEWIKLTTRHGDSIGNPGQEQMRGALVDVFSDQDEEHPDCWLECGSENGELVVLSVFNSGYALAGEHIFKITDDVTGIFFEPDWQQHIDSKFRENQNFKYISGAGVIGIGHAHAASNEDIEQGRM